MKKKIPRKLNAVVFDLVLCVYKRTKKIVHILRGYLNSTVVSALESHAEGG